VSKPRSEDRFGLFRFRSPLLTESRLLSFPLLTEMFQFSRFAPCTLCIRVQVTQRVVFPHSEIFVSQPGYRLHEAYRRFLRPSSPLNAKTSTVCPYRLDHADPIPTKTRVPTAPRRYVMLGLARPQQRTCTSPCGPLGRGDHMSIGNCSRAATQTFKNDLDLGYCLLRVTERQMNTQQATFSIMTCQRAVAIPRRSGRRPLPVGREPCESLWDGLKD
jgi:hypothetical protein